jgi:hypothetical protein
LIDRVVLLSAFIGWMSLVRVLMRGAIRCYRAEGAHLSAKGAQVKQMRGFRGR